jgi:hypothetical protein
MSPLLKGKKNVSKNISELVRTKPSSARAKGIKTLAKRKGISTKKAKQLQSVAIAMSKARKK